jgi:hypothetical protein
MGDVVSVVELKKKKWGEKEESRWIIKSGISVKNPRALESVPNSRCVCRTKRRRR